MSDPTALGGPTPGPHRHSTLRRLVDELTAHAEVLGDAPDDPDTVLDEFRRFLSTASTAFAAHILEEESVTFPSMDHISDNDRERLLFEHRRIAASFDLIMTLTARGEANLDIEMLQSEVARLEATFAEHDENERRILGVR